MVVNIKTDVKLSSLSTFKIGGPASFFVSVQDETGLKEAIGFAHSQKLPVLILGDGSNILFPDEGYRGLVLKMDNRGIEWNKSEDDRVVVKAGAGVNWDYLVSLCVDKGLYGVENLSGIPGSVGAAPIQNIGAYGVEVEEVIDEVEALNLKTLEPRIFGNNECKFAYRDSFFKTSAGENYVITKVSFVLNKSKKARLDYRDLREYFASRDAKSVSPAEVRHAVLTIRARKFPDLSRFGCAGSFFKNPRVSSATARKLKAKFPELPAFEEPRGKVKLSAAYLIDKVCGLKGLTEGNSGVFENQPLVLVNYGKATAREIKDLASYIKGCVKEKTGIELKEEVRVL